MRPNARYSKAFGRSKCHSYQGLSQAEAAELLGVAVRTVKLHWMKARLGVQQTLGGSPFDDPGPSG